MTFHQKIAVVAALAAVIGLVVIAPKRGGTLSRASGTLGPASGSGFVTLWLAVVGGALIVVGFVSNTVLRHLIQIAPFYIALGLLMRGSSLGVSAAAPLFAAWLLIMGAIWLFLLGLARIFMGNFTPVEVALTIVIGVGSMVGLGAAWRRSSRDRGSWSIRAVTVVAFAFMQFAALWLSVQPYFATR
jgi:hypothetical protein